MFAEYKRDVSHNYLILHGDETINTTSYQVRILTGNIMSSILKCRMQGLDGTWLFYYDITSKQPLALITSEMQMLSDSQPQLCFNEHWDNIMENLNYIRELLDELSRYQNAGHISLVQTNLSICLDRITSSFRPALDYLGISFETDIPRDLPQISLDQIKIRQALFNLLRNAQESIQHTHGKILFSASAVPDGVQITISDNGCGMTEDQIENAFRPFVTYKPGGTGLGLAVTRQIIEAHQGSLCVESTPKEGTSFYIFLPG